MPVVTFIVPREKDSNTQHIGFHLSILMVYIESDHLFCAATKKVKYQALNTLHTKRAAPNHPLETLAEAVPPERASHWEHQEMKAYEICSKLPP